MLDVTSYVRTVEFFQYSIREILQFTWRNIFEIVLRILNFEKFSQDVLVKWGMDSFDP